MASSINTPHTHVILVENIKYSTPYSYSETETVQSLKERISEIERIPANGQRLYVEYGWKKLWKRVDISDLTEELLIKHLKTALKIKLFTN